MHRAQITIQQISQNRLKGRPSTIGSTRSQSETVKHIAMKGISPSSIEARDGGLMSTAASRLRKIIDCGKPIPVSAI
jgi:hypothetical protein